MAEENIAAAMDDSRESSVIAEDLSDRGTVGDVEIGADTSSVPINESVAAPDHVSAMQAPTGGATAESQSMGTADLSMILDIPVTLSMEIGQTRISISELLKLSKDSVIELQRMADEPMDVLVNGTLVAHGEAVVVGERFGIRLTDVISPQERLSKFT